MKVAVSATGTSLSSQVDPRFGRCPYFLIVETDSMSVEAYPNENAGLQGGAGIQAAGFVANKGAKAVLTGRCGPNAVLALAAAGVDLYEALVGVTVQDAVKKLLNKELTPSAGNASVLPDATPTVPGFRQGFGRGQGRRGGKMMGAGKAGQGGRFLR